jgi:LmbE family N-acetylglucosaminyl deacetylase
MRRNFLVFILSFNVLLAIGQTPKTYTSSEILLQLKKLNVLGSVLYVAAHPDDENTRLLAYLANEKMYRTGYLSLTRGDGGQNLIGDEQGIDLGLIRTQELLSARRIDGAEQFFSRAYDFGFCKTSDEALSTWGHDKILSDAVWVIRKFRPDVIIARFPEDSRAGHGHHAASAIIAREAFDAAADPTKFPEQLKQGVSVWQAKRLLWNTFNFGNTNTTSEDQFKLDVGMYNPLLGKGYGEIAGLSRSQHKSQGFGVPAQRGSAIEYFTTVKGDKPVNDLMDGVNTSWDRTGKNKLSVLAENISKDFLPAQPEKSVTALVSLYKEVAAMEDGYWKTQKLKEIQNCIETASGLFLEATTNSQYAVQGDSLKFTITANNRLGLNIKTIHTHLGHSYYVLGESKANTNISLTKSIYISPEAGYSQPYWLRKPMDKGSFNVADQQQIGMAENEPPAISFWLEIEGTPFTFNKPLRYKYTDPVRGELYQPISILPVADVKFDKDVYLLKEKDSMHVDMSVTPNMNAPGNFNIKTKLEDNTVKQVDINSIVLNSLSKDKQTMFQVELPKNSNKASNSVVHASLTGSDDGKQNSNTYKRIINYDHIPSIVYQKEATTKIVYADIKIAGKLVGYIPGAGDKVPQALEQMGYKVVMLAEKDIKAGNLKQYDAIVTGVRTYNTNEWMNNVYDALMDYVKDGGILVSQYNTSNQIGPVKAKIAPYPFTISRNRVTDQEAAVNFLLPDHPVLNYPNKITSKDFEGWIQERSIYNAEKIDSNYQRILSMKDPGESDQDGSLIIANYGKGRFVYTGLVFFRELPAGVPGAYRLFANLIALPPVNAKNKSAK